MIRLAEGSTNPLRGPRLVPAERRPRGTQPDVRGFATVVFLLLLLLLGVSTLHSQSTGSTAPLSATPMGTGTVAVAAPPVPPTTRTGKLQDAISKAITPKPSVASTSLAGYLERVRLDNAGDRASAGAIWIDSGRLARLSSDVRAMRPHDLISVVIDENLAASTDGTVKNSRATNANSSVSGLIGTLHAGNALQNLLTQSSASGLNAQGQSATNSSLSTVLGGQVIEVLANGMLVIEAARQEEFSQQTQTIILRGLVRPEDISQQNQILSTAISSLELEVKGKGIINDYTHRQNPFVRFIEKVLVF